MPSKLPKQRSSFVESMANYFSPDRRESKKQFDSLHKNEAQWSINVEFPPLTKQYVEYLKAKKEYDHKNTELTKKGNAELKKNEKAALSLGVNPEDIKNEKLDKIKDDLKELRKNIPVKPRIKYQIPEVLIKGGSVENLNAFLTDHENDADLSDRAKEYIKGRINAENYYTELRKMSATRMKTLPDYVEEGDIVMMTGIHQNRKQATGNGCYSCSMGLLLQSRGLNLEQEQIRAFRPKTGMKFTDAIQGDLPGSIGDYAALATSCLPNVAIISQTIDMAVLADSQGRQLQDREFQKQIIEQSWNIIEHAMKFHHSPVSVLRNGHYRTIVGYNKKKGTVMLKDSLGSYSADYTYEIPISSLTEGTEKLNFTNIADIKPNDPASNFSGVLPKLNYIGGNFVTGDDSIPLTYDTSEFSMPVQAKDNNETISFSDVSIKKDVEIFLPANVKSTIKSQSSLEPEKLDRIHKLIREKISKMLPEQAILHFAPDGKCTLTNYNDPSVNREINSSTLRRLIYLQNVDRNLEKLYPYAQEHCLDADFIDHQFELISPYNTLIESMKGLECKPVNLFEVSAQSHLLDPESWTWEQMNLDELQKLYEKLTSHIQGKLQNNEDLAANESLEYRMLTEIICEKALKAPEIDLSENTIKQIKNYQTFLITNMKGQDGPDIQEKEKLQMTNGISRERDVQMITDFVQEYTFQERYKALGTMIAETNPENQKNISDETLNEFNLLQKYFLKKAEKLAQPQLEQQTVKAQKAIRERQQKAEKEKLENAKKVKARKQAREEYNKLKAEYNKLKAEYNKLKAKTSKLDAKTGKSKKVNTKDSQRLQQLMKAIRQKEHEIYQATRGKANDQPQNQANNQMQAGTANKQTKVQTQAGTSAKQTTNQAGAVAKQTQKHTQQAGIVAK